MSDPIIGYASRNHIREVLAGYPPAKIERYFALGDFFPRANCNPICQGEERRLVERFYAAIDFSSPETMQRFFVVLAEILHDLEPSSDRWPWQHPSEEAEELFGRLIRFLGRDGIEFINGEIRVRHGLVDDVNFAGLPSLNEADIARHIARAKTRLSQNDYPAAITVSYTLIEQFLKAILSDLPVPFNESEGDIRHLYALLKQPLDLNPDGQNIETHINTILNGLQKQISGLYDLANKASDRHATTYEPQRHHALLAINTAFTLCEYLLGVWESRNREKQ